MDERAIVVVQAMSVVRHCIISTYLSMKNKGPENNLFHSKRVEISRQTTSPTFIVFSLKSISLVAVSVEHDVLLKLILS